MNESRRYEQDQRVRRNEERYDRNDRQGEQYGQGYGQHQGYGQQSGHQYGQQQQPYGQRPYDQDDRVAQQWRDQGDGRFAGSERSERRGDDRGWEWDRDRSTPQQIGDRDSSRAWRGTGGGSYQGGGADRGQSEWGGSYAGGSRESFSGRGPKGYRRSDDRIREAVSDRLTDDHSLDASEIEVEVKDGEVTLKGTVSDRQQKRLAEDLAESCSGVSDVTNNIRVSRGDSQSQTQSNEKSSQSGSQKTNSKGSGSDASM